MRMDFVERFALRASVAAAGLLLLSLFPLPGTAAEPAGCNSDSPAETVKEALQREIYGQSRERTELLAAAVQHSPSYAPARWQQGLVRDGQGNWQQPEQYLANPRLAARLTAYERQRDRTTDSVEGNLSLADWCGKRELTEQVRAHLTRVIDLAPDHAGAREWLGFVRRGGEWFSRNELARERENEAARQAAVAKWQARIQDIRAGLEHRSQQRREHALQTFQKILDAEAVPAIEVVFADAADDVAIPALDVLAGIADPKAALALTRFAVTGRTEPIREAAARRLSKRDPHTFVPQILASMYTPVTSRFVALSLPTGRIGYRHEFSREGQNRVQFMQLDTEYQRLAMVNGDAIGSLERALDDLEQTAQSREQSALAQNEFTSRLNERLAWVLRLATGQSFSAKPEEWWAWWNQRNEVYSSGSKPVSTIYDSETRTVVDRTSGSVPGVGISIATSTPPPPAFECLAAGTVVWTIKGPLEIELIRVGDQVLSQDSETGELAFKPVLKTTIRPAGPLVRIAAGVDTIQASGGHLFWVAGEGWMKARDLQSGQVLHGARGPVHVSFVEPGEQAQTYNLIVADFSSYFVGYERLLSHDNTPRQTTRAIVPGLVER